MKLQASGCLGAQNGRAAREEAILFVSLSVSRKTPGPPAAGIQSVDNTEVKNNGIVQL